MIMKDKGGGSVVNAAVSGDAANDHRGRAGRCLVALYIADLGGGGAERVFVHLANGLSLRGFRVDLVAGTTWGSPYLAEVAPEVRVVDFGVKHARHAVGHTMRYLRRHRPAVLISARATSNIVGVFCARVASPNTRTVLTIHSMARRTGRGGASWRDRWIARLDAQAARMADRVVAVSRGAAEEYAAASRLPREKIHVIYNPVITPEIDQMAQRAPAHPWVDNGDLPVVLAIGGLHPVKRFDMLIRAFAAVRARGLNARLIILGEGVLRRELEGLVRELGMVDSVAIPGFDVNPYAYLRRARVFALSSASEALPTVIIEALACGCRVVATDCPGGTREILRDGRLGRLVPVGDSGALAEAICEALVSETYPVPNEGDLEVYTREYAVEKYADIIAELVPCREPVP